MELPQRKRSMTVSQEVRDRHNEAARRSYYKKKNTSQGQSSQRKQRQLHIYEHVITLTPLEASEAEPTSLETGFRSQLDITPRAPEEVEQLRAAVPRSAHESLYANSPPEQRSYRTEPPVFEHGLDDGFDPGLIVEDDRPEIQRSSQPGSLSTLYKRFTRPRSLSPWSFRRGANGDPDGSRSDQALFVSSGSESDSQEGEIEPGIERSASTRNERARRSTQRYRQTAVRHPSEKDNRDSADESAGTVASVSSDEDARRDILPDVAPAHDTEAETQSVTEKLFDNLIRGFHGCSLAEHDASHQRHQQRTTRHTKLSQLFAGVHMPSTLDSGRLLSKETYQEFPLPVEEAQDAFFGTSMRPGRDHGTDGTRNLPRLRRVCLHAESSAPSNTVVAFDIDSCLGFAESLSFIRSGLDYEPAPNSRLNIRTDLHVGIDATAPLADDETAPRTSHSMLKDVPHFHLGRFGTTDSVSVYILFPMYGAGPGRFEAMLDADLASFYDAAFYPALQDVCPADVQQHLPASFHAAKLAARAAQSEGRVMLSSGPRTKQSLKYHIQPQYLEPLWRAIRRNIRGLDEKFSRPRIFFSAKNLKLRFKSDTLSGALTSFMGHLHSIVDVGALQQDLVFVDIAKEVCPSSAGPGHRSRSSSAPSQVMLWKRCCIEAYMRWMYDEADRRRPGSKQYRLYYVNMLHDACNLSSVTTAGSEHRRGGLVYTQLYSSHKAVTDVAQLHPFQNEGLEDLALDADILKGLAASAKGRFRQRGALVAAYCASKDRANDALRAARERSFGLREEHRITLRQFHSLRLHAEMNAFAYEADSALPDAGAAGRDVDAFGDGNGPAGRTKRRDRAASSDASSDSQYTQEEQESESEDSGSEDENTHGWEDEEVDSQDEFRPASRGPRRARDTPPAGRTVGPASSFAWTFDSAVYFEFLWRLANRATSGFEIQRVRSIIVNNGVVKWEDTKLMIMFLRLLRYTFAAHQLARESAFWWSERKFAFEGERPDQVWFGLGFQNTLKRYGFCWIEPRVDFARWTFVPRVTDDILFGNLTLRKTYFRHGAVMGEWLDTNLQFDHAFEWLGQYQEDAVVVDTLVQYVAHLVLLQYRRDCLHHIVKTDGADSKRLRTVDLAVEGFTYSFFRRILRNLPADDCHPNPPKAPYLTHRNRSGANDPLQIYSLLFGHGDGVNRRWGNCTFRTLHARALRFFETYRRTSLGSRSMYQCYVRYHRDAFLRWHWVIPNHTRDKFHARTSTSGRYLAFVSIIVVKSYSAKRYVWGRQEWRGAKAADGRAPPETQQPLPEYVSWDKDAWESKLLLQSRRRAVPALQDAAGRNQNDRAAVSTSSAAPLRPRTQQVAHARDRSRSAHSHRDDSSESLPPGEELVRRPRFYRPSDRLADKFVRI